MAAITRRITPIGFAFIAATIRLMAEQTSIVASRAGAGSDTVPTDDHLVAGLRRLGIRHLRGRVTAEDAELAPANLLAGLARSSDARLRAALLPLFLWRRTPESAAPSQLAVAIQRRLAGHQSAFLRAREAAFMAETLGARRRAANQPLDTVSRCDTLKILSVR